ncbi:ankyrin repeat-containing protein [Quercus suber]|uniref:Ankyrin repeat-containing protein n=1 Tax=Quercus suber TaxID=58331 RepID=A0AAW0J4T8_QUESU
MDAGMFKAAIDGNEDVNLNLTQLTEGGNSVLHVAAISGKVQIARRILAIDSQPSLLYKKNKKGDTALHIAARLGHFNMTKHLITCANDREVEAKMELLRMENLEKNTALHEAIKNDYYDIMQLLIKEDPGLTSLTNNAGESPLFLAVDRGFYKIAIHILEAVPKCSNVGRKSMNVLHAAVIRTQRNRTALHLAAENGNSKLVKVFLQTLATEDLINQQDKEGNTPFHLAAIEGRYALLMMLAKDRRIDWMAMNKAGMSTVDIIQSDKRLKSGKKEKFMSKLNRDDIRLSLERIVDRHTMEVQTFDTEGHGQLIQETERNEHAEQNKVKDTALIATKKRLKRQEAIRKMVDLNFVVATIIASVTYAAVIQVPGGNDDDGEAALRENKDFKKFMFFNACAFVFSLLSMLFHFCIGHVSLSSSIGLIYASLCFTFTQFSLLGITGAFFLSVSAVLTKSSASKSGSGGAPPPLEYPRIFEPSQSKYSNVFTEYWIGLLFVFLIFAAVFIRMNKKLAVSILKES